MDKIAEAVSSAPAFEIVAFGAVALMFLAIAAYILLVMTLLVRMGLWPNYGPARPPYIQPPPFKASGKEGV